MLSPSFSFLCLAWLADMVLLAAIGPIGSHVLPAMVLYGLGFVLMLGMVRRFPRGIGPSRAYAVILLLGLAARLVFLILFPANSDINRYIWEGAVQGHGFNPYALAPGSPVLDPVAVEDLGAIRAGVNHGWIPAVYPPLALLLFRGMAAVSPSPLFFKCVFTLFDLGVLLILAVGVKDRGLPPSRLLLYAANPLVIVFVSGEGHLDVVQVFFLGLGWLLIRRERAVLGAAALGMAVMSKYLAAAAVPCMLWTTAKRLPRLTVFLPLALFLPFADGVGRHFESLAGFGGGMHYNDSVAALLRMVLGSGAAWVAAGILTLCMVGLFLTEDDGLRAGYLAVGSMLVLLPTVHPWYLVLVAPFMCFYPSAAWVYLQAAVLFTFPVLGVEWETGVFREIHWLKLPEYLPFFGLLVWGWFRTRGLAGAAGDPAPRTISVIIPTLNEAGTIERCLASVQNDSQVREVIVADGGSNDDTVRIAGRRGTRIVSSPKGRGGQIRAGVEIALGEVLVILHADCVLRPGSAGRILGELAANPVTVGGCLGMEFDTSGWRSQVIAALSNIRAMITGISFGNQAQFFRAEALRRIGGFPHLMLMEDVEVSLRLKTIGRMAYLGRGVVVSARRWSRGSFKQNFGLVVGLFLRYLLERRLGRGQGLNESYFRRYYGIIS
jgi:rSAM/selenodomain-associated transferase 2